MTFQLTKFIVVLIVSRITSNQDKEKKKKIETETHKLERIRVLYKLNLCFKEHNNMVFQWKISILIAFCIVAVRRVHCSIEEEEHGVIYANRCEACKILAIELEAKLQETGKSHDVIEVGYAFTEINCRKNNAFLFSYFVNWYFRMIIKMCCFVHFYLQLFG